MKRIIRNVKVVTEEEVIVNGTVVIGEGIMTHVRENTDELEGEVLDGKGQNWTLVPGFIDIHIHGAGGSDVMDGTPEALRTISQHLPQEGTTAYLATTMTQSVERIRKAVRNVAAYQQVEQGAEVLGIHLEGPFINAEKAGAQPVEYIQPPSIEQFVEWQQESRQAIKLVTLAPEVDGAMPFVQYLEKEGIRCSIGHSQASFDVVNEAIEWGATQVTHLFNQMSSFHHREPGIVGAAFLHDKLLAELIVDHIHVHPKAVEHAFQTIGADRLILITDAMRAKCLAEGDYTLAGQEVHVHNGGVRLSNGTLAGSVLTMEQARKNMLPLASLRELVKMTSENAAKQLGVYDRIGSISVGKEADLVLLNEDGDVLLTLCKGEPVYQKEKVIEWTTY